MNTKDRLLKKLCTRWDAPTPQLAINEALRSSFPDLQQFSPPIPLGRLAVRRGVGDIVTKILNCDGIISETTKGSYIIQVNRNHSETRRRFTIAHELGHTFFFDVDSDIRERVRDGNLELVAHLDPEEMLCNYAAAEILMPRKQFGAAVRETGRSAKGLVRLAKTFNVSVHAATRRLVQVVVSKLVIVQWEYVAPAEIYRPVWVVGLLMGGATREHKLLVRKNDPAFKLFNEKDVYRGRIWISLNGPMDGYFADLTAWRAEGVRRVLTMFVLERNPEQILAALEVTLNTTEQMTLF